MQIDFDIAKINKPAQIEEVSAEMAASNPIAQVSNATAAAQIAKNKAENGKPWIIGRATRDCAKAIW